MLTKIFINSKFENKNIRRHDYVTKAIIKLIIDEKLNDNPRWVQFEEIKNKQKYIITGYESEMEENEIDKLIDTLNNMDINENENKFDENLRLKVNNSESEEISESENLEEEDEKEKYENNKSNMDIENNNNNNLENLLEENFSENNVVENKKINLEKDNNNNKDNNLIENESCSNNNDNFDDIEELLIGNSYINTENSSDNYYEMPLKERLKKRAKDELAKKITKCKKRKIMYPKDYNETKFIPVKVKKNYKVNKKNK